MFDTSRHTGHPATFSLPLTISGWRESLTLMVEGEKRRLWVPGAAAYGGRAGFPQGMLVFDVELLRIVD